MTKENKSLTEEFALISHVVIENVAGIVYLSYRALYSDPLLRLMGAATLLLSPVIAAAYLVGGAGYAAYRTGCHALDRFKASESDDKAEVQTTESHVASLVIIDMTGEQEQTIDYTDSLKFSQLASQRAQACDQTTEVEESSSNKTRTI